MAKRTVDGILIVDKPLGMSSNHCLQAVRHLLNAAKAGHTGALDPLASGVLPLCFGEATKVSQVLLDADKTYLATIRLGVETATCDAAGEVLGEAPVPPLARGELARVLRRFEGTQRQVAPVYSALKQGGVPQYKLARAGLPVAAKEREITIHSLILHEWQTPALQVEVRCSKGTYVRSLARDIGAALGCGGHLSGLRRLAAGPFTLQESHTLEHLREVAANAGEAEAALDALLLPVDFAVSTWPALHLGTELGLRLWQGQALKVPGEPYGHVRLYSGTTFLGIGRHLPDGGFAELRLLRFPV
ncbi:MAG TPA: tRNA pseudouridine(55) synthase TruB [Hyphomicrobiales bacterium]|nr:tRNA pseudouridine(55) synthase TruB [Hyphomicrobiales bacterium]